MSRLLRGFYSTVRNQWNSSVRSAPQSVCHEDEGKVGQTSIPDTEVPVEPASVQRYVINKTCPSQSVDEVGDHLPSPEQKPPLINRSQGSGPVSQNKDNASQIRLPLLFVKGFEPKYKKCFDRDGPVKFDMGGTGETHTGKDRWEFGFDTGGTENDGRKKQQRQQKEGCFKSFSDAINQGHTPLESLGWGVALVLGIHLSKTWDLDKRAGWSRLYRQAVAMPMQNKASHSSNQTPASSPSLQDRSSTVEHQEDIPVSSELEFDSPELREASTSWEELSHQYTSRVCERLAGRYRKHGDYSTAAQLWQQAAELGSTKASYNLALCYHLGRGVDKDISKAVEFYRVAGNKGHHHAQYNLAVLSIQGLIPRTDDNPSGKSLLDDSLIQDLTSQILNKGKVVNDPEVTTSNQIFQEIVQTSDAMTIPTLSVDTQSMKLAGLARSHSSPSALYQLAENSTSLTEPSIECGMDEDPNGLSASQHFPRRNHSSSNLFSLGGVELEHVNPTGPPEAFVTISSAQNANLLLCT